MGRAWARNLAACDRAVLAGWVDWRPEAAEQAVVELGLSAVETFQDIEAGLAAVKPDFVVDVTSPESHHAITLASLAAGIPVLGEKPMAISMEQAREMVAASERSGKLYMVSQSRRYDPRIRAFRKLVAKHVGPPGILNSDFYIGAHFGPGPRDGLMTGLHGRFGWPIWACRLGVDCLLYTSDAADELLCVDLGGRRIIKKKKKSN